MLAGASAILAVAPRAFLVGPLGRKWLHFVGIRNVLAVRIVCCLSALMFGGLVVGIAILAVAALCH